jgi:hypothetical protein
VSGATYPVDDLEFDDVLVKSVGAGGSFERSDGWSFCLPDGADVVVRPGMTARFYGRGIGFVVRGLFIDGVKVFYRTPAEQDQHALVERFGATAADWLAKWDSGAAVWSVEMGGMGPGYEQCIQITAAQILRHMLDAKYDASQWGDGGRWPDDRKAIETFGFADDTIKGLGLSGAQWGAACSLAACIYKRGPIDALSDPAVKERLIMVSKSFPGSASA